jgi:HSP90 family molecular chaperone
MEDLIKKLQQFKENDPEKFNTFKSNFNKVFGQISGN